MLNQTELARIERELRRSKALTVYVANQPENPAERTAWRRALADGMDRVRRATGGAPHAEREALEASIRAVEAELTSYPETLPAHGWVAFATAEGVRYRELLPVAPPAMITWQDGIRVAPYLAARDNRLTSIIAVVDSRQGRVYRFDDGMLEKLDTIRSHAVIGPVEHMGYPPSTGFHTGTRGATGADAAQRELLVGRQHMLAELAQRLTDLSAPNACILVGGIPEVAIAALAALPQTVQHRAHRVVGLDVHARDSEIAAAALEGAKSLREAEDLAEVDEVLARWAAAGHAVVGPAPIRDALESGAVAHLYMTRAFIGSRAADAESLTIAALDQGAPVDVVGGGAATRLDAEGDGLAAALRFQPYRSVTPVHANSGVAR
ncbi:MAG TPA: hypothetical protein VF159_06090 [Gemmatimonadaceae bacterium]